MKKLLFTTFLVTAIGVTGLGGEVSANEMSQATSVGGDSQPSTNNNAKTELIYKTINNRSNLPDGSYPLVYADGVFNVGFDAVIENDQFVKVQNPWHDLLLVDVVKESLSILSPKEAVYYLTVTDGQGTWNQNLHVKIIDDEFFYFFTN